MKKVFLSFLGMICCVFGSLHAENSYGIPEKIQDGNILHCFDWTFNDIKAMLPQIAQAGFGAVQVSPVQGNCNTNAEWFFAYMPYDFVFKANGNGSRQQLKELCDAADQYGIKIIVDVVANHMNKASGYHDSWWDSNGRVRWNGGCNYGDRNSITHGQLGDYGDVNSESAEVQNRCKAFIQDLKSLGVKGIRWDAAKHIGLPSEGCQFWPAVTTPLGLWNYGEILDGPGGDGNKLMKEYTNYMSVTDNGYSKSCREAICNGSVPGNHAGWAASTIDENKVVYWGESHDEYSNDGQYGTNSAYIAQDKIDRAWALTACRAGATSLYFSRPSATSRAAIKMGQKGSTHFTSKEIAAVNHLRNAAVGTKDYYSQSNGVACITRQNIGACIVVGSGGARQISVPNGGGFVPAGQYRDEITGNTFNVTSTTISGQVGSTGIAVIYNSEAAKQPYVDFNPAGGSFKAETLSVTAKLVNATSGWYKIGSGAQQTINSTATFTIGQGVDYNQNIDITWSATGSEGTKTGSVSFTKKDPNAVVKVYYNNPGHWGTVHAYIYSQEAGSVSEWPGEVMLKGSDGLWCIEVPEPFCESGYIIFNDGTNNQYPAQNETGLPISGKSMICRDNSSWNEYTGSSTTPDTPVDPQPGTNPVAGPTDEPGVYVYLYNSLNWPAPTVWAYDIDGRPCGQAQAWPGDIMTSTGQNNLWIWKAQNGKKPANIIFSNSGQNQTANLVYNNKGTYTCAGVVVSSGTGFDPVDDPVNPPTPGNGVTIYYNNPGHWSSVNAYIYIDGGAEMQPWPGSAMSFDSAINLWKIDVPAAFINGQVIFNGNGSQYPTSMEPGLQIGGKSMVCRDNSSWTEYTGGSTPVTPPTDSSFKVYWDNSTENWQTPMVHFWGGTSSSNWPGENMSVASGKVYVYTVPAGTTGLVFNDGNGNQSGDMDALANHIYTKAGDQGVYSGASTDPVTPPTPAGSYTVKCDASAVGWNSVKAWIWDNEHNNFTGNVWPGQSMTLDSDGIFTITVTGSTTPAFVIFSCGSDQTLDFAFVNGKTYKISANKEMNSNGTMCFTEDNSDEDNPGSNPSEPSNPSVPTTNGSVLQTNYYKVNPNGQVGTNKTITVSSGPKAANMSNWTAADLIAQGVARDVCQAFKGVHERPIVDSYALYAAFDSQNLYLGVQYVYTIWDKDGEGYQAGESKPYNMDGKLMIAFDLDPAKTCDGTMVDGNSVWQGDQCTTFDNGMDCVWMGSTKPGVGTPGLFFPNAQGKFNYSDPASCKTSRVVYGYSDGLHPSITAIYGQANFGYNPALLEGNEGFVDLIPQVTAMGGNNSAHTFYEYKFPLADLGISESYLKNYGIGVMIVDLYGSSAHATLPYDASMYDNVFGEYSMDPSSSKEKEDQDVITSGFARIGKLAMSGIDDVVVDKTDISRPNDIYTMQGVCLKHNATEADIQSLRPGLYIIAGKKVIIK